ncbi:MAG: HEPN domain-containing protein [bacterium]|nr:HEPN domain-containing protein [bacterium]
MSGSYKLPEEWLKQADYDLGTAKVMFDSGRYIYTIFMCHLTIEKALKGLYAKKLETNPPRSHNLNYICEEMGQEVPENFQDFMDNLNNLSVPTRYPDQLAKLLKDFKKDVTKNIYNQSKELLQWLKEKII